MKLKNLLLQKDTIRKIVYHGGCTDGFCSAFIAWYYFKTNGFNMKEFEFIPEYYKLNNKFPNFNGFNVLICDYSYNFDTTVKIINDSNCIAILDHHKTNLKELEKISEEYKYIDITHSAAYITWVYFFGEDNIPDVVLYVEDTDLYTKKLPYTNEIFTYISQLPFDFTIWEDLLNNSKFMSVIPKGITLLNEKSLIINDIIENNSSEVLIKIKTSNLIQRISLCESNINKTDLGVELLKKYKNCNFSVVVSYLYKNGYSFSLRSTDDRTDVGNLSKIYFNGGGHRNSSGCKNIYNILPYTHNILCDEKICNIIDNFKIYNFKIDDILFNSVVFETLISDTFHTETFNDLFCYLKQNREGTQIKEYQHIIGTNEITNLIFVFSIYSPSNKTISFIIEFLNYNKEIISLFNEYFGMFDYDYKKFFTKSIQTIIEINDNINFNKFLKKVFL